MRRRKKTLRTALMAAVMATALASCDNAALRLQPDSGGRPYEVILAGDTDSTLYRRLSADMTALPQAEPMFDVDCIEQSGLNTQTRLARSIVEVNVDPELYGRTSVKYEKNVYAEPQMIVRVGVPTLQQLHRDADAIARSVAALLSRHETNAALATLRRRHNPKMEAMVREMFGIDMLIPSDMKASKRGKGFIWISNDSPTAMRNICIYTATDRDSVMRANIKGETDSMYMATVSGSVTTTTLREKGDTILLRRGLWEMRGDAMGGPFVSHTLKGTAHSPAVTLETFVYAPGMKKRNLLLLTEAALYSAKTTKK